MKIFRGRIAIIPQDPFLFSGTVRENLDPQDMYEDGALWGVLERCHLRAPVEDLGGLQAPVTERGKHFSQGQRQLMCLARALLTKAKVDIDQVRDGRSPVYEMTVDLWSNTIGMEYLFSRSSFLVVKPFKFRF